MYDQNIIYPSSGNFEKDICSVCALKLDDGEDTILTVGGH